MGRSFFRTAFGALILLIAPIAQAADLAAVPEPQAVASGEQAPMAELGTGWYLRGDVSFAKDSTPRIAYDLVPLSQVSANNSWSVGGGFGYRFNNWFRADWTFDYRNSINVSGQGVVTNAACSAIPNGCALTYKSTQTRWASMVNGYVDISTGSLLTPYVGAGIGISHLNENGAATYPNFAALNWSVAGKSVSRFAWALMTGIAVDVAPHTEMDIGYRFLSMGTASYVAPIGGVSTKALYANEFRVGFRFTPDL
jgi:opacity protein-like surface antigen